MVPEPDEPAPVRSGSPDANGAGTQAKRSQLTRERVLEVALAQLEAGGEAAVRVDRISTESGVSIGSIYHHFHDRDGVIAAAQVRRFARSTEEGMTAFLDEVDGMLDRDGFRHFLLAGATVDDESTRRAKRWQLVTVMASTVGRAELEREIIELQTRLNDRLAAMVSDHQASGVVRSDLDARAIVAMLWSWKLGPALNDLDAHGADEAAWLAAVEASIDALLAGGPD